MQRLRTARRTRVLLAAVVVGGVAIGFAVAGLAAAEDQAADQAVPVVSCPSVADQLADVPARAQAEVERNLAQLEDQIADANRRLASSVGQGGPNFVDNAILGPLENKRRAALERIAIAIGRQGERPEGLAELAACSVDAEGGSAEEADPPAADPPAADPGEEAGAGDDAGDTGGNTAAGTIVCPDVVAQLPAVPAQAQAEVDRNLAQLGTQIAEANQRLADSVGQGGPDFVQNAILGPLADKRRAALDRIALAIGRQAAAPTGLDSLATCSLEQ